jgi:hypothetical protein
MTAEEHIIAWIESSQTHYNRLLDITRRRQPDCRDGFIRQTGLVCAVINLVTSAYGDMLSCGDASRDDEYSAAEILNAASELLKWEAPQ